MRRLLILVSLLAALGLAPAAAAEIVTRPDDAGRTITFDVQTPDVDVDWYATLLRGAAHGDEIERVTVRVVDRDGLAEICGASAAGCYGGRNTRATITVPAGGSPSIAHTVLHEYGHHIDAWRGVGASTREPNGSASWWEARGIAQLLAEGKVAHDYGLGWDRSIGELFAEDYAQLHLETPFKIGWLTPPDDAVRAALRQDLENVPAEPVRAATAPLVITRTGKLQRGGTNALPFELLGPGRRVTYTARIDRAAGRVRVEVRCTNGTTITRTITRNLGGARRSTTIDIRNLGPARCSATIRSTGTAVVGFSARLRLAIEPAV